jgi:hypothetical protein
MPCREKPLRKKAALGPLVTGRRRRRIEKRDDLSSLEKLGNLGPKGR